MRGGNRSMDRGGMDRGGAGGRGNFNEVSFLLLFMQTRGGGGERTRCILVMFVRNYINNCKGVW